MLACCFALSALAEPPTDALVPVVESWSRLAFRHPEVTSGRLPWDPPLLRALSDDDPAEAWRRVVVDLPPADGVPYEAPDGPDVHPWLRVDGHRLGWHPPTHSDDDLPAEPLRMLAVARTWAVLRWAYPYMDGHEARWLEALPIALQAARDATTPQAYHGALDAMIAVLPDGHLEVEGPTDRRPRHTTPFAVRADRADRPWVLAVGPGAPAALRPGDRLLAVDGEPWSTLVDRVAPHGIGGTPVTRAEDRIQRVFEHLDGVHRVTVGGAVGRRVVEVPLGRRGVFPRPTPLPDHAVRREDAFAVLDLQRLRDDGLGEAMEQVRDVPGLVVDGRGYPPYLPQQLVSCLSSEEVPTHEVRTLRLQEPERWHTEVTQLGGAHCPGPRYEGPVVLLLDRITYSRGEYIAQAIASVPRIVTLGEPTAGTDGNRVGLPLPGRVTVWHSSVGIALPDGTAVQGVGLQPHVDAPVTRRGVRRGRDEPMQAALDCLRTQLSSGRAWASSGRSEAARASRCSRWAARR